MSVKALKKQLIAAVAMVIVAVIAVSSSTFAWFAQNKTVQASTMSISATSDMPYLAISETSTGTFDTNADAMVVNPAAATALKLVTPLNVASNVAYYATLTDKTAEPAVTTTPSKFTNAASVLWGTTSSSDPALVEAANVTDKIAGTGFTTTLDEFVQVSELWFKVLNTDVNGSNLTCTGVTFTLNDDDADTNTNTIAPSGRLLLVSETGKYQLYKVASGLVTSMETGSDAALIATVTNTAQKITCFFYFDGTDTSAYTNNATELDSISAALSFTID
ncbi:MAG: hypothetical protein IJS65_03185 [Clostridia bacterium]|nr:hypothetical protein [Clostridia bacterium]